MLAPEHPTPDYWPQRADDIYAEATRLRDAAARRTLIQIAKTYAAMATRIESWDAQAALMHR